MPLTDMKCRNAKPGPTLRKLFDGGGLQLWVQPTGARLWRLAYRFGGKQKLLALGVYPVTSLAGARQGREAAKHLLVSGVDPSQAKKQTKAIQGELGGTFRVIAEDYVSKLKQEGRAGITITKIEWLLSFAYPIIGDQPIKEIGAPDILRALREIEMRGRHETAHRLRSTIGSVFGHIRPLPAGPLRTCGPSNSEGRRCPLDRASAPGRAHWPGRRLGPSGRDSGRRRGVVLLRDPGRACAFWEALA